ncbi:apoptosis-inducing factor 1 [Holotrichia oblita]|uniref:Apoptosis-inducing factor 1 n=1 Tax=Holotrichia oblita TaxID=644536 RepID=A0ACB9SIB4_HOLOL|nr:apoptosis-inducing factor 1 [Holotrichia oblita]
MKSILSFFVETQSDENYVEGIVCKTDEIRENEMKSLDLGEGKILLVKQNGKLSAIGAKCTHYGAPLSTGALGNGRVRCPWHGACFNITTGDIEDFPGLDSLPCYQVLVEGNNVKVRARKADLETNKRTKSMCKAAKPINETFVILGAGPSGATCAETLRQEGFTGRLVVVAKEKALPYDRVKVTKSMDVELSKIEFRTEGFYKENGIEMLRAVSATSIDSNNNTVSLSNGTTINYNKLYIATGGAAKKAPIPGADLKNVMVMRNFDDGAYVQSQLTPDTTLVVLGGSYIAMESAAYCVNKVKKVTVVMHGEVPFKPLLGARVGAAFKKLFEEKGVHFVTNSGITKCIDNGAGSIGSVELSDGTTINADLCIMGIGSTLYTEFVKSSGVEVRPDGSIEVDEYMRTNVPNVFAGGDLAYAPVWSYHNKKSVIGHYPLAHMHGKIAALNMLDKNQPLRAVPFFWTMLFGKGIRYAGHGRYDDIMYTGDVEALKFIAYYLDGDEVVAVASCQMDPNVSIFAEILAQGKKLTRSDLTGTDLLDWTKKVKA